MHAFLDLDGTLTDPGVGITRCIAHALERLGHPSPDTSALGWCVGPPLAESFRSLLGTADEPTVREAIAFYRERFTVLGMFENQVYAGIPECLQALRESGFRLRVVTSKPTVFAAQIVRHFDLERFLDGIHGSELDGTRSGKGDLISHVLQTEGVAPGSATMVGDRSHDVVGARQNGLSTVGVLWGYGTLDELAAAGAHAIVRRPDELLEALHRAAR